MPCPSFILVPTFPSTTGWKKQRRVLLKLTTRFVPEKLPTNPAPPQLNFGCIGLVASTRPTQRTPATTLPISLPDIIGAPPVPIEDPPIPRLPPIPVVFPPIPVVFPPIPVVDTPPPM